MPKLVILGFEEWANRANVFPVFLDWSKGCLNIYIYIYFLFFCTRYTLKSWSQCVWHIEVAGDFGPVFVEDKAEYFK